MYLDINKVFARNNYQYTQKQTPKPNRFDNFIITCLFRDHNDMDGLAQ